MGNNPIPGVIKCAHNKIMPVHKLVPNPRNPNKHPEKQIEMLAKIIDHQGQRLPIVVSNRTGFIVSGHGRLQALKKLGWESAAIDYQDFDTDADEYAHMIADNKIAELAKHDDGMMIEDIKAFEFTDFELLWLSDFELPVDPDEGRDAIEDDVPSNVDTRCKLGDVWLLGDHRLMCGDSTSVDAVDNLMNGQKADITFTSPPYNADKNSHLTGNVSGFDKKYQNHSDDMSDDSYLELLTASQSIAIKKSRYVFCNLQLLTHNRRVLFEFQNKMKDSLKDVLIWVKNIAPPNIVKGCFSTKFEYVFVFSEDNKTRGFPCKWQGKYPNVIETENASKNEFAKIHKATFPVSFPTWIIEKMDFAKSVYDPFGGSGSTLIACEKTKRRCFMMELDPHYCDVILSRWEKYSGKTAELVPELDKTS